jgi:hypothetical protein
VSRYVHTSEEWATNLQHKFGEYMSLCYEYAYAEDDTELLSEFTTVSGQPFCGCDICEQREALMFLIPEIIDAYKAGIIVEE